MLPLAIVERMIVTKEQKISRLVNEVRQLEAKRTAILDEIHRLEAELTPLRDRLAAEGLPSVLAEKKAG